MIVAKETLIKEVPNIEFNDPDPLVDFGRPKPHSPDSAFTQL